MRIEQRLAIVMAGGGAAGKSTATKTFAIGNPDEHIEVVDLEFRTGIREGKIAWTLFDNCALAGNYHSGSDSNNGPSAIEAAFIRCMEVRNISIVDGMCSSPKWITMCNEYDAKHPEHNLEILLLHFDLDPEDLMDRLASRRGTDKETFRERMFPRCRTLTRRAELLKEHCENLAEIPYEIVRVVKTDTPDDIVDKIDDFVCNFYDVETMEDLIEEFGYGN